MNLEPGLHHSVKYGTSAFLYSRRPGYRITSQTRRFSYKHTPSTERSARLRRGRTKEGGVCVHINNVWCTIAQAVHRHCSPDVEMLLVKCRSIFLPRDFSSVIILATYIPPQASSSAALGLLYYGISARETKHPGAVFIFAGDFNHCSLRTALPKFHQIVKFPTRENKTLDHVYCSVRGAYRAVPRPHFGQSDTSPCSSTERTGRFSSKPLQ
ncbi:hypothetical protein NFI96_008148 [Prochilodus magdalenae]|nr:hypothetical protein NFI96_008148 [Prochilodus magdalenae]